MKLQEKEKRGEGIGKINKTGEFDTDDTKDKKELWHKRYFL